MLALVCDTPQFASVRAANADRVNLDALSYEPRGHALDCVCVTATRWTACDYNQNTLDVSWFVSIKSVIRGL